MNVNLFIKLIYHAIYFNVLVLFFKDFNYFHCLQKRLFFIIFINHIRLIIQFYKKVFILVIFSRY